MPVRGGLVDLVSVECRIVPDAVDLFGLPFHRVTESQCISHILERSKRGHGGWVITPNLDIVRMAASSREVWDYIQEADLVLADGMPVVWASRILADPLPERVAGSSLVSTLSAAAARKGVSVYLLGGDPGTASAAAAELQRRHSDLRIAGTYCPPFGFERSPEELARIESKLARSAPGIVFVALGCPKQERLIVRVRAAAPQAWFLGVGISFSYLCGEVQRAPAWMRRMGLEWFFRMAQDPRRLLRRYLREDVPFGLRLAALAVRSRWGCPWARRDGGRARPSRPSLEPRRRPGH